MTVPVPAPKEPVPAGHRTLGPLAQSAVRLGIAEETVQSALKRSNGDEAAFIRLLHKETGADEAALQKARAAAHGWDYADVHRETVTDDLIALVPRKMADAQTLLPVARADTGLRVAMLHPENGVIRRLVQKKFGQETAFVLTTETALLSALGQYDQSLRERVTLIKRGEKKMGSMVQAQDDRSIIQLVDTILQHSVTAGASDVHIEPGSEEAVVRQRVDGILRKSITFQKQVHDRVVQRIKVMANLATDEHAMPQDGRLIYRTPQDKRVDVRVSIVPTMHGENVVLRLLVAQEKRLSLDSLGCSPKDKELLEGESRKPWGMILVTGPTGSGKSTTLHTITSNLNSDTVNISTIEDPVEYEIPGANQIQVNEKTGLTFASGLRALVRQDPNIILVGEIRDRDTATIAVNAAMTGHLVLSTLHTNNAATAIPRLVDMDIQPFMLASVVNIVVGQRLIRTLCPACAQKKTFSRAVLANAIPPRLLEILLEGKDSVELMEGKGCEKCGGIGFQGRTGIFEILAVTAAIRELIMRRATADEVQREAIRGGMTTMEEDGMRKVKEGVTTVEEFLRVLRS